MTVQEPQESVRGTPYQLEGILYRSSAYCVGQRISYVGQEALFNRRRTSIVGHSASCISWRNSCVGQKASSIGQGAFCVCRRARVSRAWHPGSYIDLRDSCTGQRESLFIGQWGPPVPPTGPPLLAGGFLYWSKVLLYQSVGFLYRPEVLSTSVSA